MQKALTEITVRNKVNRREINKTVDSTLLDPAMKAMRLFQYNNCFDKQGRPTKIKTLWDETLSIGTDTYRLKFHNKLIRTYKDKQNTLSREDCIVFMETYYNAAIRQALAGSGILYLEEQGRGGDWYDKIRSVWIFGPSLYSIKFGLYVREMQFKDDNRSKESKVLNSWLWLCESLKQELLIYDVKIDGIDGVSTIDKTSSQQIGVSYSSVSVLFYRKYFLDDILEERKKKKLEKSAIDQFQSIKDNDIIYTKYNLMYNYLILGSFGKTEKVKLENIIKAIQLPVLSIEITV
ncbi:unnamed protein product [Macrosiphum euphorbiae]|uniref:LAGLIDADG homing endonuclease n=1 Tax=Macrosiphum euphorbiae TaxID=13131 RepID=A0AAV0WUP4_9HEMI|nr:unnamed protein product [Macrosiphum euphorbiae]